MSMKRSLYRHWPFLITGPVLAFLLVIFWYFNQTYLSRERSPIALLLENPILTFGLIIFGAFISSFIFGEYSIKTPVTYEPLAYSFVGGIIMGIGAVLAAMSVNSVVLFNLAGIFNLTAFMVTKGWVYAVFMLLGGLIGSKFLISLTLKTQHIRKEFHIPEWMTVRKNQKIIFYTLIIIFVLFIMTVLLFSRLNGLEKILFSFALLFLIIFGIVVERGTICMSSMLKELFMTHSAYVWRSVLFTIMCLALLYQIGLRTSLYEVIKLEPYVQNMDYLVIGSFLMGFGFIFADGCFIGSLWKAGQGNIINIVGIFGMLIGMGGSQVAVTKIITVNQAAASHGAIPNYINSIVTPTVFLILLWAIGTLLFIFFKPRHYKY